MKYWLTFSIGLLVSTTVLAADDLSTWSIQHKPRDEDQVSEVNLFYLINENQRFRLTKFGAKNDPRFELVGVDQRKHIVWLLASPFESREAKQRFANMYQCRSIAEPQQRKNFYSICNSRFAIRRDDVSEVDTEKLRLALDEAGFLSLMAEEQLSQYRADFAKANTASSLKRFIEQYRDNDHDGLVEQATNKIPKQELDDYRASFNRAMSTPIPNDSGWGDPGFFRKEALRRFVDTYRNNDPEHLVARANQELLKVQAEDEHQRQWHWKAAGERGNTVCLEVQTDSNLLLDEKRWQEARLAQIVGTTEETTPTKLKVFIHQIMMWKTFDIYQYVKVDSLTVDGIKATTGKYSWFERSGWRACKAK